MFNCIYYFVKIAFIVCLIFNLSITKGNNNIVLSFKDSFILQENDSTIINNISNINYSTNGKYFALNSESNPSEFVVYNSNNYKIKKIINSNDYLTDSLIEKTKPYFDTLQYIPIKYLIGKSNFIPGKLNDYNYSVFVNDSILYILSIIRSYSIPKSQSFDNYNKIIGNMNSTLIKYNINNNSYQVIPCGDTLFKPYNQGNNFIIDKINNRIYSTVRSGKKQLESGAIPVVISKYDDDFHYLGDLFCLPDEHYKTKLNYLINYSPDMLINSKNDLIAVFPFVEKVYNVSKNSSFDIFNLKNSNKDLFNKLLADENLMKKIIDSIYNFLPNYISKIYESNNREYIIYIVEVSKGTTNTVYPFIQVYDMEGNFMASLNLEYLNKNGKLKYFHYSKIDNKIRMFRLNDDNWIVEEYEWELK